MQYWSPAHWVLSPHSSSAICVAEAPGAGLVAGDPATGLPLWEEWEALQAGNNSNETATSASVSVVERMMVSTGKIAHPSRIVSTIDTFSPRADYDLDLSS